MIAFGASDMTKAYVGSTEVSKAYLGDELVWGGSSPALPYDAEVEYIQGGIFNTSFVPPANAIHTWKYLFVKLVNYSYIFSVTPIENGKWYIFGGFQRSGVGSQILYGSSSKYGGSFTTNTIYNGEANFSSGTKTLKINGSTKISLSASSFTNTYPFTISLSNGNNVVYRFYWYQCKVSGQLISDIIPVRIGNIGYLYDRVSGELIESSADSPLLGPDIT